MPDILSGKQLNLSLRSQLTQFISTLSVKPCMALIQVGEDPASSFYVSNILKFGERIGAKVSVIKLPMESSFEDLTKIIVELNNNPNVNGIMLQRPLPHGFNEVDVNILIAPEKDIDAINPVNLGKLMIGADGFIPCTPYAVQLLMRYYKIEASGKNIVIIGRSNVVGKPLACLLLQKGIYSDATITVCHSKTNDLRSITQHADVLIAAIGSPKFVKSDMIGPDTIVIDVGINEVIDIDGNISYTGDVDYEDCFHKCKSITPVPGGVGSITTAILFVNLLKSLLDQQNHNKKIDDFLDVIFNAI